MGTDKNKTKEMWLKLISVSKSQNSTSVSNFQTLARCKASYTDRKLIILQPDGYTRQTPKKTYHALKTYDLNGTHAQLDLF